MQTRHHSLTLLGAIALCAGSLEAVAQVTDYGTIVYAPLQSARALTVIPTLSSAAVVLLALLVAAGGYWALRKTNAGRFLAWVAAAGLALATATAGLLDAGEARADGFTISLTSASGGSVPMVPETGFDIPVINTTGVPQIIRRLIDAPPIHFVTPTALPACVGGSTVLQAGAQCYVRADATIG